MKPLMEVCVDSLESALAAQAAGADRVELCSALTEGGLTPSAGLLDAARARLNIAIAAMIRPRGADFCYSADEFDIMRRDMAVAKRAGADAIVLGLLNPDGTVDEPRTRELVELARPLPVTFHRAFDVARDPHEALDALIRLGVHRVLTSGQERSALEGLDLIVELMPRAGDRIILMPGGGITERNVQKILKASRAREFHVSASGSRESRMTFRNTRVPMGKLFGPSEYQWGIASESRARAFRQLANESSG